MHLSCFICSIFLPVELTAEAVVDVLQLLFGIGRLHNAGENCVFVVAAMRSGQAVYISVAGRLHEILVLPKRVRLSVFAFIINFPLPILVARPRGRAWLVSCAGVGCDLKIPGIQIFRRLVGILVADLRHARHNGPAGGHVDLICVAALIVYDFDSALCQLLDGVGNRLIIADRPALNLQRCRI